tara:strand:- start:1059 stop:1649 length:591 start_codon:yes stop_codon:yes gene_type:complete
MAKQNIHIINFKALFDILEEIKPNLSFEIFYYNDQKNFLQFLETEDTKNFLILADKAYDELQLHKSIDKKQIMILHEIPISINKLIENINVCLIKQKYNLQSLTKIKDYNLDLNSRLFSRKSYQLKLTQKEIDIILFLFEKSTPQSISTLQNKVWGYSFDLETHTVETHIYRLRKKIKDLFNDDKFIISHEDGYLI